MRLGKLLGYEMDRIPSLLFHLMAVGLRIRDKFHPVEGYLEKIGLKRGQTVIDYGCGPGSYVKRASEMVGGAGRVYALDVHELALEAVERKIRVHSLNNVRTVLVNDNVCKLEDNIADVIYALDMFHMVAKTDLFLEEVRRLLKEDGYLTIEPGHQPRAEARERILKSRLWDIQDDGRGFFRCTPRKN